jgi:hypothetical protein
VDALHPRGVHEDLKRGPRLWGIWNLPRQQFQCDRLTVRNVEVGSNHRLDHGEKGAQNSIMIKAGHIIEGLFDLVDKLAARRRARLDVEAGVGIETSPE